LIGQVILVGAGPGDPGLLTLKGRSAIESAEVVVYDRLVSPAILELIPKDAERINVGKESSHHLVPQDQINQILLDKALEGKRVVRLKGGDPFLFGRGGEELELLTQHGVPFQEVPGITSAIAVPAYCGIPVTHRDFCSSLHIITGHLRAGKKLEINFDALVAAGGTLVFLMGVSALEEICTGLLKAGMDPAMPAAVLEKGTTPMQRPIISTLEGLPAAAKAEQVKSPAIIVVGKVCSLSQDFDWFDKLPLKGRKIVVTRPRDRAGTLSRRLRELGAEVLEYPCIETVPVIPCPPMEAALEQIGQYEWLAFTSPAGVSALMGLLERQGRDVRALGQIRLAAIGPGTDRELRLHGLRADLIPSPVYDGAHLGQALGQAAKGKVLILRAELGTPELTDALAAAGVAYDDIHCYTTRYENADAAALRAEIESGTVDLVTFTSASTVRGFVASVGDLDFTKVTGACIGAQTAAEAQKYGIRTLIASSATMDALIQTIMEGC
jgi:uroporphyrinogen III methyltransferase/synthase